MRSDTEVYLGFYLQAVWFIGWSNLLTIMMYWQLLRVRYMVSVNIQGAFRRLDVKISGYLSKPSCPAMVRTVYQKVKGFMVSMGDMG